MSITDELMEWWVRKFPVMDKGLHKEFAAIADRIDAAHRSALEKLAVQLDETSDMRDFIGCIEQAAADREDVTLWGVDYTALPVDADGVPIRIGDKIEYLSGGRDIVRFVTLNRNGWLVNERGWEPCTMRHYRTPTVEDVLREFTDAILEWSGKSGTVAETGTWSDVAAEYASKLRLAGEGE